MQDLLQVFQGSRMEEIEDNCTRESTPYLND